MEYVKVSALTPRLTGAEVALDDVLLIVDVSAGADGTKGIEVSELLIALEANLVASFKRTVGDTATLTVDTVGNIASCTALDMREYAQGEIHIPAGSSVTSLVPYVCSTSTGTYTPANDEGWKALTMAVAAGQSYPVPYALSGTKFVKFTANVSGTITVDPKS